MNIPEEKELIEFLGSRPQRESEEDSLFYDTAAFAFSNRVEDFKLTISPFYDKFILTVKDHASQEIVSHIELRSVQKLEIVNGQDYNKIRLLHGESDIYQNVLEFTFNPRFKMMFEEQYR
ncbi:hypothetical protein B0H99_10130 [Planomicrobium soli]|uniref:Uncharacterized protein n=1 Tax=Planomicrobium soli TaxID=1176648 RepID=A0A2P8H6C7_9BACL|nr:hypothetical protein [Planomicrobium soli]PSL41787.1 hypothetical protein B0H99_10130 [Planomicrobium soli]